MKNSTTFRGVTAFVICMIMSMNCLSSQADTVKHERVFAVAGTDGTVETMTVNVRLENADELDELKDRTRLREIRSLSGEEPFTQEGEDLIWQAGGKDIVYQGVSDAVPQALPRVTITLNGAEATVEDLKHEKGEAKLTVSYVLNETAPVLAVSLLPLPTEGVEHVTVENARIVSEMGQRIVVGYALPGFPENLALPESFTVTFDNDHADLSWMMTLLTSDPVKDLVGKAQTLLDIPFSGELSEWDELDELDEIEQLIGAMAKGEDLPETTGLTKQAAAKIGELNQGLVTLDDGALALSEGTRTLADGAVSANDGAEQLDTGLATLSENSQALRDGADTIFQTILDTANQMIAQADLDALGVSMPTLTRSNYPLLLATAIAGTEDRVIEKLIRRQVEQKVLEEVQAQEEEIRADVTDSVRSEVLDELLKQAGLGFTSDGYVTAKTQLAEEMERLSAEHAAREETTGAASATDLVQASVTDLSEADDLLDQQLAAAVETSDRYASIDTALEEQMAGDEVLKRIEARVKEAINAQTAEKTEFAMTCDETVLSTLEAARTGHEQLVELRSELEALSTFVKGITAYTEGVDQAAQGMQQLHEGLKQLSDGAQTLADGAGTLYAQGTKVLRQTLTDLQKNLAEKLLPYVHNEAREAVSTYEEVRDSVGKLDFDLQGEDMKCVLVTIVRTDLKK